MKTILCYGDSNTYGYNPANGMRYPKNVRWPGCLGILLGNEYEVIEEGCNGRTTVFDDPIEGWKNGLDYLRPCLNTHKPIDLVIMMLGSNDLKEVFGAEAKDSAAGAATLVDVIIKFTEEKQGFVPKILFIMLHWVRHSVQKKGQTLIMRLQKSKFTEVQAILPLINPFSEIRLNLTSSGKDIQKLPLKKVI